MFLNDIFDFLLFKEIDTGTETGTLKLTSNDLIPKGNIWLIVAYCSIII